MDDVLDNICSFHHGGSIYRHVPLLVSDLCPSSAFLRMLYLLSVWWAQTMLSPPFALSLFSAPQRSPPLSRLPFYYELKIAFVVWLLSPYTKGSSVLYRKFVHPTLSSKEKVRSPFLCQIIFFTLSSIWERGQGESLSLKGTEQKTKRMYLAR